MKRSLEASDFEISNETNGAISFDDIDFGGRFIRLVNTSQEVCFSEWMDEIVRIVLYTYSIGNTDINLGVYMYE